VARKWFICEALYPNSQRQSTGLCSTANATASKRDTLFVSVIATVSLPLYNVFSRKIPQVRSYGIPFTANCGSQNVDLSKRSTPRRPGAVRWSRFANWQFSLVTNLDGD